MGIGYELGYLRVNIDFKVKDNVLKFYVIILISFWKCL